MFYGILIAAALVLVVMLVVGSSRSAAKAQSKKDLYSGKGAKKEAQASRIEMETQKKEIKLLFGPRPIFGSKRKAAYDEKVRNYLLTKEK
jgi:hypothetical protein